MRIMCRFCVSGKSLAWHLDESIGALGADMEVGLDGDTKIIIWSDVFGTRQQSAINISYCPKCGRKL